MQEALLLFAVFSGRWEETEASTSCAVSQKHSVIMASTELSHEWVCRV